MAKEKPTQKKSVKKSRSKPSRPPKVIDTAASLEQLGFFRGEYWWELERHIPAFDARLRLQVDHPNGVVKPEQLRALNLLLEAEKALRPLALRAAFECMQRWVERYRQRHPGFRGKPLAERTFNRGCDLGTVLFPAPKATEAKPAPVFILGVFWPDDNRPCEARFEWIKGAWTVTECERN